EATRARGRAAAGGCLLPPGRSAVRGRRATGGHRGSRRAAKVVARVVAARAAGSDVRSARLRGASRARRRFRRRARCHARLVRPPRQQRHRRAAARPRGCARRRNRDHLGVRECTLSRNREGTAMSSVLSAQALYAQLALPDSPAIIDVRDEAERSRESRFIPGSFRAARDEVARCARTLARGRPVVVCSTAGRNDEGTVAALVALGHPAFVLEGGLESWLGAGFATVRSRPELHAPGGSRWITRERPKIDRLACPWLVRRFIDPDAAFFYTPPHQVRAEAQALRAEPYD